MKAQKISAVLTPIDDTKRVVIRVNDRPQQIFDISTLMDYEPMAKKLKGQPYRVYSPDNTVIQTGVMSETTSIIKTPTTMKIRCEIGAGKWSIETDGYNDTDVDLLNNVKESNP